MQQPMSVQQTDERARRARDSHAAREPDVRGETERSAPASPGEGEELVARLRAGDERAFEELYASHRLPLRRFLRSRIADRDDAEDLLQETFVQAIRSIGRFAGRSTLQTWLFGIARNLCSHYYRHSTRWMVGANAMSAAPRDALVDARIEARVDARRMLDRIGQQVVERRGVLATSIFYERFGKGRAIRHIAAQLGKSSESVKMNLRRTRMTIQESLPECRELAS